MAKTSIKILQLLNVFEELTDESHRLNVPQLEQALSERGCSVERKAIYRDIDRLRELGYPVESSPFGYYLQERDFSLSELQLLISAVQAASFISERDTRILVEKLAHEASLYQGEALKAQANLAGRKDGNSQTMQTISRVNEAIARGLQIRFFYYKRDLDKKSVIQHDGKSYSVSPYAMIWLQDRYYLVANMEGREDLTHFRLDRMQDTELLTARARPAEEVSAYRGRFDAADYARKCPNMFGGEVMSIRLRCHRKLIDEVLERFGEATPVQRSADSEEHFEAFVRAAAGDGFLNWVGQFGERMEILSPPELRRKMSERLRLALSLYEEPHS